MSVANQLVGVKLLLSPYRSNLRCIVTTIITVCVLLATFNLQYVQMSEDVRLVLATEEAPPASWHFIRTNLSKADNLITDARDGSILFASNGTIFKYSNQLEPMWSISIGNPNTQRINKVLTLVDDGNRLMSCGQLNEKSLLTCMLYDLSNLTSSKTAITQYPLTWSNQLANESDIVTFKSDPNELIFVHSTQNASRLLMMTRRTGESWLAEGRLEQVLSRAGPSFPSYFVPAVAGYELSTRSNQLIMTALLPYQPRFRVGNRTIVQEYDYLYSFIHESHTYFVLNNIEKNDTKSGNWSSYEPRLARVCNNDTRLTSYTEVGMACGDRVTPTTGLSSFYANAAYLDKQDAATLHVAFENMKGRERGGESHLCSYSMDKIQGVFEQAIKKCLNGDTPPRLLAKLHALESSPACRASGLDSCTSSLNPYIDGVSSNSLVEPDSHIGLEGYAISDADFLVALTQGGRRVYFLGADDYWLTKLDASGPLFDINLAKQRVGVFQLERERSLIAGYDADQEGVNGTKILFSYALGNITAIDSRGVIQQLPVDSCQYYTNCYSCHTIQDPLGCVWCGDKCERRTNCATFSELSANSTAVDQGNPITCPPSIYAFSPHAGPTSGQNTLIILGDGLGGATSSQPPKVTLGDQDCVIDSVNSNDNKIECEVKPVHGSLNDDETSLEPKVIVRGKECLTGLVNQTDLKCQIEPVTHEALISVSQFGYQNYGIKLEGTATATVAYQYKQVSVFGIDEPASGPSGGGTEITIEGENLDVCRKRTVMLGDTECDILRVESTRIVCKTRALVLEASRSRATRAGDVILTKLTVLLDGSHPVRHKPLGSLSEVFYYRIESPPEWTWSSLLTVINIAGALAIVVPMILVTVYLIIRRKYGAQKNNETIARCPPDAFSRSLSPTNTDDSTRPNSQTGFYKSDGFNNMSGNHLGSGMTCTELC